MALNQDRIVNRATVILGLSELLLKDGQDNLSDSQRRLLQDLHDAARELKEFLNTP